MTAQELLEKFTKCRLFVIDQVGANKSIHIILLSQSNNFIQMFNRKVRRHFQKNWFDFNEDLSDCLVIGNPPFGVRNKLSIDFIKHSEKLNAATIAFILPNVFKKHTMQKHITYGISDIIEIPIDSFTYMDNPYKIPCSFFILNKDGDDRMRFDISKYQNAEDFDFVSKTAEYDFFIMGAAPYNVKTVIEPNNRGYYIKCKSDTNMVKQNFQNIKWSLFGNSSASGGVSWFTKPEIVKIYNSYINDIQ